jgi:hypothetical protein
MTASAEAVMRVSVVSSVHPSGGTVRPRFFELGADLELTCGVVRTLTLAA